MTDGGRYSVVVVSGGYCMNDGGRYSTGCAGRGEDRLARLRLACLQPAHARASEGVNAREGSRTPALFHFCMFRHANSSSHSDMQIPLFF